MPGSTSVKKVRLGERERERLRDRERNSQTDRQTDRGIKVKKLKEKIFKQIRGKRRKTEKRGKND